MDGGCGGSATKSLASSSCGCIVERTCNRNSRSHVEVQGQFAEKEISEARE